jgi:acyl-CoA dehydrogenase
MTSSGTAAPSALLSLQHARLPEGAAQVRADVRAFLAQARADGMFVPRSDAWHNAFSPEFSAALGARGWVGMTWSEEYGGHDRPTLERFVVLEEVLAAGAPVAAHWIADRQSAPQIFRHGTEPAKRELLPRVARGECFFSIGMSEPDSGSDLASVRTRARRVEGGWRISGTKVWTSQAERSHYITVLCRTSDAEKRHAGLSVLIADLAADGLEVRPIKLINGEVGFNEIILDDVFVPDEMMLGKEGEGWKLVTSELSLERSGPERILSTFILFEELVRRTAGDERTHAEVGLLAAQLWTLRQLSMAVAAAIDRGRDPAVEAALVKDLGTKFERRVVEVARKLVPCQPSLDSDDRFEAVLGQAVLAVPGLTLRGGTSEILRGIVARGLGARR